MSDDTGDPDDDPNARGDPGGSGPAPDDEFGRQGWLLVAGIVVAFVVVPAIVYASGTIGVPFRVAYLVLPLVPAVVLALVAVWVTTTR